MRRGRPYPYPYPYPYPTPIPILPLPLPYLYPEQVRGGCSQEAQAPRVMAPPDTYYPA